MHNLSSDLMLYSGMSKYSFKCPRKYNFAFTIKLYVNDLSYFVNLTIETSPALNLKTAPKKQSQSAQKEETACNKTFLQYQY